MEATESLTTLPTRCPHDQRPADIIHATRHRHEPAHLTSRRAVSPISAYPLARSLAHVHATCNLSREPMSSILHFVDRILPHPHLHYRWRCQRSPVPTRRLSFCCPSVKFAMLPHLSHDVHSATPFGAPRRVPRISCHSLPRPRRSSTVRLALRLS